jgi:hypothetical protein
MPALSRKRDSFITICDPEKGLRTIAVAKAGEEHWFRAKNVTKVLEAIETKIMEQAKYIVWRDSIMVSSQDTGAPGRGKKGKRVSGRKPVLPASDPGKVTAHRWRKQLCCKDGEGHTVLDSQKIERAFSDVALRSVRIIEQGDMSTIRGIAGTGEFERYTPEYAGIRRRLTLTLPGRSWARSILIRPAAGRRRRRCRRRNSSPSARMV